jgi:hypothetical protein
MTKLVKAGNCDQIGAHCIVTNWKYFISTVPQYWLQGTALTQRVFDGINWCFIYGRVNKIGENLSLWV